MESSYRIALLLPLLLAGAGASAQIYMCKDASGRTITSDRPVPECADRVTRELDKRGLVRREIQPPLTPEQKRQMQIDEEKRREQEAAAEEQKREDRAITLRYRNENDIEAARQRSLDVAQEQIKREKLTLTNAEKQQKQAQADTDSYKKKNAAVPPGVQRRVEQSDQDVASSKKAIEHAEAEIGQINAKFDATLKRYRELAAAANAAK